MECDSNILGNEVRHLHQRIERGEAGIKGVGEAAPAAGRYGDTEVSAAFILSVNCEFD